MENETSFKEPMWSKTDIKLQIFKESLHVTDVWPNVPNLLWENMQHIHRNKTPKCTGMEMVGFMPTAIKIFLSVSPLLQKKGGPVFL